MAPLRTLSSEHPTPELSMSKSSYSLRSPFKINRHSSNPNPRVGLRPHIKVSGGTSTPSTPVSPAVPASPSASEPGQQPRSESLEDCGSPFRRLAPWRTLSERGRNAQASHLMPEPVSISEGGSRRSSFSVQTETVESAADEQYKADIQEALERSRKMF